MMKKFITTCLLALTTQVLLAQTVLTVQDTRATPTMPYTYNRSFEAHFKATSVLGLSTGFYQTVLGLRGWADDSGGKAHELAFGDDSKIYLRSGFESTGWESWRSLLVSNENGNFGIGTNNPIAKLDVNGTVIIFNPDGTNYNENLRLPSATSGYASIALGAVPGNSGTGLGQWSFVKFPEAMSSKFSIRHNKDDHFNILTNGDVGIGTTNPTEKLAVNGKIRAKEIKVEATNWPDYVFEEGYKVGTLGELESYIKANKHLPDMPAAREIAANGLELGEVVRLQQQKIEELTLHLIDKDKALKKVEVENTQLRAKQAEQDTAIKKIIDRIDKLELNKP